LWLHEIKHDGFRIIARKDGDRVRLYSRPGNEMTGRFPLIAEALTGLRSRSCIIDGEAVSLINADDPAKRAGLVVEHLLDHRKADAERRHTRCRGAAQIVPAGRHRPAR
jgi:ATP-dependent DNA ligase